jgi:hypothetical protein
MGQLCKGCYAQVDKIIRATGKCIPCTDEELEQLRNKDIETSL